MNLPIDLIEIGHTHTNLPYKYHQVKEGVFVLNQKPRYVLAGPLPHNFSFSLNIPENAKLTFGLGGRYQNKVSHKTNAKVMVYLSIDGQKKEIIFEKDFIIYPNANENKWSDTSIDLSRYKGHNSILSFIAESKPQPSKAKLLIGWSNIKLTTSNNLIASENKKPPVPKNLIIVTLDAVRYDKIGIYGSTTTSTPNIDKLAKESVVFKNAFSTAPWTLPSLTSLFSSLYPHEHNANISTKLIRKKIRMLAEIMQEYGYQTVAFTGKKSYADMKFGFFDGFGNITENNDEQNVVEIPKWVEKNRDKPFFLWVHFDAAHNPFDAPKPFFRENKNYKGIIDENYASKFSASFLGGSIRFNEDDITRIRELYEGMVDYTDYKLGKLIDGLKEKNILDKTLLVITSDHGEQILGKHDHGFLDHGVSVYDELLHVPLLIRFPDKKIRPREISELISLIDILPTVLSYFSIPAKNVQMSGVNLIPLIESPDNKFQREFIIAEEANRFYITIRSKKWKYIFLDLNLMNRFKIHHEPFTSYQNEMLFNMEADPHEQINIAEKYPKVVKVMRERVSEIIEKSKYDKDTSSTLDIDEQTKEKLKALGYL